MKLNPYLGISVTEGKEGCYYFRQDSSGGPRRVHVPGCWRRGGRLNYWSASHVGRERASGIRFRDDFLILCVALGRKYCRNGTVVLWCSVRLERGCLCCLLNSIYKMRFYDFSACLQSHVIFFSGWLGGFGWVKFKVTFDPIFKSCII